jgi:thiamine phosphate synthase YjbQ (UPF0047 family)
MAVVSTSISLSTKGNTDIREITDQIAEAVSASGLLQGIVTIFCPSSTSGVTTIEYEPGCVADLRRMFDEIVPSNRSYQHDQTWTECFCIHNKL